MIKRWRVGVLAGAVQCVPRIALVLLLILSSTVPASAHTLSESLSAWQVTGDMVRVEFTVPDLEARRLSKSGRDMPTAPQLATYLAARVSVAAKDQPCPAVHAPRTLSATAGYSRFELIFQCPQAAGIRLHSAAFYDLVSTHTDFARIDDGNGHLFEQVLTRDHRDVEVSGSAGENELENAGFLTYIGMGVMHIFTGVDHMSFMLGLVLLSRRLRDLLFVVTGFTLGHSLTLALAVTGILRPEAQFIDALVALTILLIGAENVGDGTQRPLPLAGSLAALLLSMALARYFGWGVALPLLLLLGAALFSASYLMLTGQMRDAGRVRLLVTLVFGLIHGFGFASNLLEMHLPPHRIAALLFGFNIGVEVGQLTVVLGALALTQLLVRSRLSVPRPLFTDLAAAFLIGEGLWWFLQRSISLA
jgi:HupE/UreJ protein